MKFDRLVNLILEGMVRVALIGVVKNFIDFETGDTYKSKLESKDITKKYNPEGSGYIDQHDTYWEIEGSYDDPEYIEYDRWKFSSGFGGFRDGTLMWTEPPSDKSRELVLKFLKQKYNVTPEREDIWTRFLERERQRAKLRDISGD